MLNLYTHNFFRLFLELGLSFEAILFPLWLGWGILCTHIVYRPKSHFIHNAKIANLTCKIISYRKKLQKKLKYTEFIFKEWDIFATFAMSILRFYL